MTFGQGACGDLHVVNRPVDHLVIPDLRVKGVDWSCELASGSLLAGWYTDHRAGSDMTVVGARGLYPAYVWDGKHEQVENLRSGLHMNQEFLYNDCKLRLVDSIVSRWTCWVTNESNIALRNCDILDYMVWDRSESSCEDSTLVLVGAKNESRALLRRCHLLTPDWGGSLAAGRNSVVDLQECTVDGSERTVEGGSVRVGVDSAMNPQGSPDER